MAMPPATQQGQRLVMSPLLQQTIQVLPLSTPELEQVVLKESVENPLLEEMPEERLRPRFPLSRPADRLLPRLPRADGRPV